MVETELVVGLLAFAGAVVGAEALVIATLWRRNNGNPTHEQWEELVRHSATNRDTLTKMATILDERLPKGGN